MQGDPVTADSLRLAGQAGKLTDDAVMKLADSWLLACREKLDACAGTGNQRSASGKGTVRIIYPMGLERVVCFLVRRLEEEGYAVLCCRPSVSLIAKPWGQSRDRDSDQYKDIAGPDLFLDNALKERRLSVMRKAAEDRKSQIRSLLCTLVLKEEMDQEWISDGTESTESAGRQGRASAAAYTRRQQKLLEKMTEEEAGIIPGGLSPEEDPGACIFTFSFRLTDKIGKN